MGAEWSQPRSLGADENGQPAEKLTGEGFTPSMFATLGVKPEMGRVFAEDEDQIDAQAPAVLISDRLWRRRFEADPSMVGKVIRMDGVPVTVIGGMPPGFYLWDNQADYWNPLQFNRLVVGNPGFTMSVVASLKPGLVRMVISRSGESLPVGRRSHRSAPTAVPACFIYHRA